MKNTDIIVKDKTKRKRGKQRLKKCSHFKGETCVYCIVTGGDNYKCSLFLSKTGNSLHDDISNGNI